MTGNDFTLDVYRGLLSCLKEARYSFASFRNSLIKPIGRQTIILRHDVDLLPYNSLRTAELEASLGIQGVYYFRAVPESWDEKVIRRIAELGHEVGYHYESLTTCHGDVDAAYCDFCRNFEKLRTLVDVKTICMHGSPRSPFDSKEIWKKYSYRDLGIIGEPYFDVDFDHTFYLTDTGRRWDGYKVSVRDKIEGYSEQWAREGKIFHSTRDIIRAAQSELLPDRIMITVHPQRWNPFGVKWCKELILQSMKNKIKRIIILAQSPMKFDTVGGGKILIIRYLWSFDKSSALCAA